ncbi:MAG: HD domain-containing protein [Firmicutes bacterium]|nr:HD domain-containing protein [Bacillota bacterium]
MGKIADIPKKLKNAFTKQGDFLLLLELAAIMLIATAAANYIFNYTDGILSSGYAVKSWEYIYTDSSSAPSGAEWKIANSITPLSKEKTGEYLHLRGSFHGKAYEQTLVIKADYAPTKISVNGETVYDNHYGDSEYVGNVYNAVVLPAAGEEITVEISLRLPFSADIEAYITKGGASAAFSVEGGLVFSGVLLLLGAAAFLTAIVFCFAKRKSSHIFAVSALITAYGAAAGVFAMARESYLFNFPGFCNISIALEFLVTALFTVAAAVLLKVKDKRFIVCLCLSIASIALILSASGAFMLNMASLAAALLSVITVAVLIKICKGFANNRIQYAKSAFLMLVFLAMSELLGSVMQVTRYRTSFASCRLIGEFIFLFYIVFVLISKAFYNRRQSEVLYKTNSYNACVTKAADIMKELLCLNSEPEICKAAAEGICGLYRDINSQTGEMSYTVLMKENSGYKEVCRDSFEGNINCAVIENRCADSQSHCVFNETYTELAFCKNGSIYIIFHFENLQGALSPFFTAIVTTLYSGIEVALTRFSGNNTEQEEIGIFTKLARETETASGNNPDHIENVARYTGHIMEAMGYPQAIRATVAQAAMLHDIGKIAIPSEITNKTGLLSESERRIIKMHTEYGYVLLSVFGSEFMQIAATIANEHHERYDGKGYNGIAGDHINEYARITAVADTLDALTAKRSYKEGWPLAQAIEYIDSNSGTLYDPKVVAAMHECIDKIGQITMEKK